MDVCTARSPFYCYLLHIFIPFSFFFASVAATKCFLFHRLCRYIGKELARKQFLRQASINFWRGSHGFSNSNIRPCLCMRVFFSAAFFSVAFFFTYWFHHYTLCTDLFLNGFVSVYKRFWLTKKSCHISEGCILVLVLLECSSNKTIGGAAIHTYNVWIEWNGIESNEALSSYLNSLVPDFVHTAFACLTFFFPF